MVQKEIEESAEKNPLWERIVTAFGTNDVQTIADKLGISYQAVGKYKKGKAEPSKKTFSQIEKETGRSLDWLMTGKDNLTDEEREENRFKILSNKFGALTPSKKAKAEVLISVLERELERMETELE